PVLHGARGGVYPSDGPHPIRHSAVCPVMDLVPIDMQAVRDRPGLCSGVGRLVLSAERGGMTHDAQQLEELPNEGLVGQGNANLSGMHSRAVAVRHTLQEAGDNTRRGIEEPWWEFLAREAMAEVGIQPLSKKLAMHPCAEPLAVRCGGCRGVDAAGEIEPPLQDIQDALQYSPLVHVGGEAKIISRRSGAFGDVIAH